MTTLSVIKATLEADATLLATATGGVFDYDETGRRGINRTATPAAFDAAGIVKPCVMVKLRSSVPDGALRDDDSQYVSVREMVECWFYADPSYTSIETMKLRVYALLHAKRLTGMFRCEWAGDAYPFRDLDLDAFGLRADYLCIVKRSVS